MGLIYVYFSFFSCRFSIFLVFLILCGRNILIFLFFVFRVFIHWSSDSSVCFICSTQGNKDFCNTVINMCAQSISFLKCSIGNIYLRHFVERMYLSFIWSVLQLGVLGNPNERQESRPSYYVHTLCIILISNCFNKDASLNPVIILRSFSITSWFNAI